MSLAELKIRLEGSYEVLEAAVSRFTVAARALNGSSWHRSPDWLMVSDLGAAELEALRAVKRRSNVPECVKLAQQMERGEHDIRGALARRLLELGGTPGGTIERQVKELGDHLPLIEFDQHPPMMFLFAAPAAMAVMAAFVFRTPAALVFCPVGAAALLLAYLAASTVIIGRKVLVADGMVVPLGQISAVQVVYGGRGGATIDITSVNGQHRQVLSPMNGGREISAALRARGIAVQESGR